MDTHNVAEKYAQYLKSQGQTLQNAKKRQGQQPHDRKSREVAYANFMLALMLRRNKEQLYQLHSSFTPPSYPPCVTPVAQLKPITIRDLRLETHHRGTYLLLRSISPPSRMTAIAALVEDENRDVILLQLYQQEDEDTREATDIVSVGTILLVKEPYFKVMADGEYGLRVDHLSDVIHINGEDPKIPAVLRPRLIEIEHSPESLKIRGNLAMSERRYWDAITE